LKFFFKPPLMISATQDLVIAQRFESPSHVLNKPRKIVGALRRTAVIPLRAATAVQHSHKVGVFYSRLAAVHLVLVVRVDAHIEGKSAVWSRRIYLQLIV
jgi:hypothetical protein